MTRYEHKDNEIRIYFDSVPEEAIRKEMKDIGIWWSPESRCWKREYTEERLRLAKKICGEGKVVRKRKLRIPDHVLHYGLKVKIKEIVQANDEQIILWKESLKAYVDEIMTEGHRENDDTTVGESQETAWIDCFKFIQKNLKESSEILKEYDLIFEYSLPGTVHERPDVFLLTDKKVISLEFKRKNAPQIDDNRDDVAQALRYKEYLQNHHKITKDKDAEVKSYLVCTNIYAIEGELRGVQILTKNNFAKVLEQELMDEKSCSYSQEWLRSPRTEMPDMLEAMEIMYSEGRIPYISDVNKICLEKVLQYIEHAKEDRKKTLILINGVPGAGKTAVGQSVVFEQNKNGEANAVYLSGNGPLVEVLQYQINQVGNSSHMSDNAIQGINTFKQSNFNSDGIPQQSVLVFDEAQRAWDSLKMGRYGYSEPEGLFKVGERLYKDKGHAVIIALYGNGQSIYLGEEVGIPLWESVLQKYRDWNVVVSESLSESIKGIGDRKIVDDSMFLSASLRADFKDCSKWVEEAVSRIGSFDKAKEELQKLQNTSLRICVTRSMDDVKDRAKTIDVEHPDWKYGCLISNFAEQSSIRKFMPSWSIGYNGANVVSNGTYGTWFSGECNKLEKACTVYGNQGLELDCPIVIFGGDYVRKDGKWVSNGSNFYKIKDKYRDPDTIVENNLRVLLTRARKEMILVIPEDPMLDETYKYFVDMGMDIIGK